MTYSSKNFLFFLSILYGTVGIFFWVLGFYYEIPMWIAIGFNLSSLICLIFGIMEKNYGFKVLIDKLENREDAFWYYDSAIAMFKLPNGNILYAESRGQIRVQFEENCAFYKGSQAVDIANDLNLTDEDLSKLSEFDGWGMNNWFAIVEVSKNGDIISDDLRLAGDYDEAIQMLNEVAQEYEAELN